MEKFDQIERVYLYSCKRILHVLDKTTNGIVYGELCRYPSWITDISKNIKYRFHLPENVWSKKAYYMPLGLHEKGQVTWVTRIKAVLYKIGFEQVWLLACGQGVLSLRSSGKDSTVPFVVVG